MSVYFLDETLQFPPVHLAEEDGLLAIGGDLSSERLLNAYRCGIFPWFSEDEEFLWWAPNPRFILHPEELKISKSMRPYLNGKFEFRLDTAFQEVIANCRQKDRKGQDGTWITKDMQQAYTNLHDLGFAHSAEAWSDGKLVGGLYGVSIGSCFFGESMFQHESNASKFAFIRLVQHLVAREITLIDCQVHTAHLERLGARLVSREKFMGMLDQGICKATQQGKWTGWLGKEAKQD